MGIEMTIEYGKDGKCPRCLSFYTTMHKKRVMQDGAVVVVKSERCICGTHYTQSTGRREFRPRDVGCGFCGERVVGFEKEGAWKAKLCKCGMNIYCADGRHLRVNYADIVLLPLVIKNMDELVKTGKVF